MIRFGREGQGALSKIKTSSAPASRGLLAVNAASRDVQAGLAGLSARAGPAGAALAAFGPACLAAAAGIAGIILAVRSALDATEEALDASAALADTAERIGVGVESLQEYRFAAEDSSVATAQLEQALTALIRRQGEAINGNKEFAKGFAQVGISIKDLRELTPEQLIKRVADGLASIENQALRIAAADRIMSEAGRQVINVFNGGAAGLEAYANQAREAGIVIDESLVRRARESKNELSLLNQVVDAQLTSALVDLAPVLISTASLFANIATAVADVVDGFRTLENRSTRGLEREVAEIEARMAQRRDEIERLTTGFSRFVPTNRQRVDALIGQNTDDLAERQRIFEQLAERRTVAPPPAESGGGDTFSQLERERTARFALLDLAGQAAEQDRRDREAASKRAQVLIRDFEKRDAAVKKFIASLETEVELLSLSDEERAARSKILEAEAEAGRKLSAAEQGQVRVLVEQIEETERLNGAVSDLGLTFTSSFEDAIVSGGRLSDVLKGIEQDLIRILARRAVTEPLLDAVQGIDFNRLFGTSDPFAGGAGPAPGSFRAAQTVGFAHGGSFVVPGAGTPDSRFVGFRATPGERVTIQTPGQQAANGIRLQVNVINNAGAQVGVSEQRNEAGGVSLDVVIDRAVAGAIRRRGSDSGRALGDVFGARRTLTRA